MIEQEGWRNLDLKQKLNLIHKKRNSREDLYRFLPSNSVGVEVGVDAGTNASLINSMISPKQLFLVDPWDLCDTSSKMWDTKKSKESAFERFAGEQNVTIIQDYSAEASKRFENHYFDWIHLDAMPTYKDNKKDLAHWLPKIKKGGYITGDEFGFDKSHWSGNYASIIEFIVYYIIKKPELLDSELEFRKETQELIERRFYSSPDLYGSFGPPGQPTIKITSDGHPFSDLRLSINYSYDFQLKISADLASTILNYIEYFPNQRYRGGSYALKVGDWADDLDYDKIIKESNMIENNNVEITMYKGTPQSFCRSIS